MPDLSFSFCRDTVVQIVIGNFSCKQVTSFVLSNFPKLVKLEIGRGCFHSGNPENTPEPYNSSPQEKESSSHLMFLVSYCDNLTAITMRQWSFTRFNKVRISNLKSLKILRFGVVSSTTTILANSNNFYYAESLTLSSAFGFGFSSRRSSFVRRLSNRKCEFLSVYQGDSGALTQTNIVKTRIWIVLQHRDARDARHSSLGLHAN